MTKFSWLSNVPYPHNYYNVCMDCMRSYEIRLFIDIATASACRICRRDSEGHYLMVLDAPIGVYEG